MLLLYILMILPYTRISVAGVFGATMLSYAECIAISREKNKLTLWVTNENKTAYMLYRKMGFYQLVFRSSWLAERYFGYRDWVFTCKDL